MFITIAIHKKNPEIGVDYVYGSVEYAWVYSCLFSSCVMLSVPKCQKVQIGPLIDFA